MEPGLLRHVLNLQSKQETQDASGHSVQSFQTYATVRGDVRPLRGRELFSAQQVNADLSHRVTIRYHKDVGRKDQIVKQEANASDRTLEVLAVRDPDEHKRWLELDCKEVK